MIIENIPARNAAQLLDIAALASGKYLTRREDGTLAADHALNTIQASRYLDTDPSVADQTAKLNALLAEGVPVKLPPVPIRVDGTLLPTDRARLLGSGWGNVFYASNPARAGTILVAASSSTARCIAYNGNNGAGMSIEDLVIRGPDFALAEESKLEGAIGIDIFNYADFVTIRNVAIRGFSQCMRLSQMHSSVFENIHLIGGAVHCLLIDRGVYNCAFRNLFAQRANESGFATDAMLPSNICITNSTVDAGQDSHTISFDCPLQDETGPVLGGTHQNTYFEKCYNIGYRGETVHTNGGGFGFRFGPRAKAITVKAKLEPYNGAQPKASALIEAGAEDIDFDVKVPQWVVNKGVVDQSGTRNHVLINKIGNGRVGVVKAAGAGAVTDKDFPFSPPVGTEGISGNTLYKRGADRWYSLPLTPAANLAIADLLTAYWKFDEAEGATRVDSVSGLVASDGSWPVTQQAGKRNFAAGFNGATFSNFLAVPHHDNLNVAGYDHTWVCWVYVDSYAANFGIVSKWAAGELAYQLVYRDGAFRYEASPNKTGILAVAAAPSSSAATWIQIAGGYSVATGRIFIKVNNLARVEVYDPGSPPVDSTAALRFGHSEVEGYGYWHLPGRIDAPQLFRSRPGQGGALSDAQLDAMHAAGPGMGNDFGF